MCVFLDDSIFCGAFLLTFLCRDRQKLQEHKNKYCRKAGQFDPEMRERDKEGTGVHKHAVHETVRSLFPRSDFPCAGSDPGSTSQHVETDSEDDAACASGDDETEHRHFTRSAQRRSSSPFRPQARDERWAYPLDFHHLNNYPGYSTDNEEGSPPSNSSSQDLSHDYTTSARHHQAMLMAEELLHRQDAHDPDLQRTTTISSFGGEQAGHGWDCQEEKEAQTISPAVLHTSATSSHPSNPAHHEKRRRRDSHARV